MKTIHVIAFEGTDNGMFKLIAEEGGEYPEYSSTKEILCNVLDCEADNIEDVLTTSLSLVAMATVKETEIVELNIYVPEVK